MPINDWLKNDLYLWARKLIQESETDDLIDKQFVLRLLDRHAQNKGDYARKIWTVIMYILWYNTYLNEQELVSKRNSPLLQTS